MTCRSLVRFLCVFLSPVIFVAVSSCGGGGSGSGTGTGTGTGTPPPAGWNNATHIDGIDPQKGTTPRVYSDQNGGGYAIWIQSDGTYDDVWAGRYDAVSGWYGVTRIETDNDMAALPIMAIHSSGNAIAVWYSRAVSDIVAPYLWSVKANVFDASTNSWGTTATLLETDDVYPFLYPDVAFAPNGDAMVVWEHQNIEFTSGIVSGRIGKIESVYYDASQPVGSQWGTPVAVSTDDTRASSAPKIGFDNNGYAIAIWKQDETDPGLYQDVGSQWHIWANRFTPGVGGGWGTPVQIEFNLRPLNPSSRLFNQQLAVDNSGNAIAVWTLRDTTTNLQDVWYNRYVVNSGWGTASLLETNTNDARVSDIAMDGAGNAMVVWTLEEAAGGRHIWARYYDATNGWQTATRIHPYSATSDAGGAKVAVDGNGNAFAVWAQSTAGVWNIHANRYDSVSHWGNQEIIETLATDGYSPDIAAANGNAVAVWEQLIGNPAVSHIYANAYIGN